MVIKYTPQQVEDNDLVVVEEIDYAPPYRRTRIAQLDVTEEPLRPDILARLRLARILAVMKAEGYDLRTTQT